MSTQRKHRSFGLRAICALAVLAVFLMLNMPQASAQTSGRDVRPPDINSTTLAEPSGPSNALGDKSDSDFWRQIRRANPGKVTIPDRQAAVLIQSDGQNWRAVRTGPIKVYGSWILAAVVVILAVFFAIRGRIRIQSGRSGRVIMRFTLNQRIVHWFIAVLFIFMALTGLIILYGRDVLIPLIGKPAFSVIASASKQGHDLFGPLFLLATLALFVSFVKGNLPQRGDLKWILKGGGFFGGHASSHRYNAGEKLWFWWAVLFGLLLSLSGLTMLFPTVIPELGNLQLANLLHGIAAILVIAFAIGHIYLGTIGMEGALEAMTDGYVDENWAREHHDLWHEEMRRKGEIEPAPPPSGGRGMSAPASGE